MINIARRADGLFQFIQWELMSDDPLQFSLTTRHDLLHVPHFSSAAFLCTQKTKPPIFFKLAYLVCCINIFSTFSVHLINSPCFCAESGIEWFQRKVPHRLTDAAESATIKAQKGILPIDGQFRKLVTKSNREPRLKGGYFFVWFMYAIKIETMIPRIIRTTVSSS